MVEQQKGPLFKGKTYSLYSGGNETDRYYSTIRDLTDLFLRRCPDEKDLLNQIQRADSNRLFKSRFPTRGVDKPLISFVRKTLRETLPIYTTGVKEHLKTMPLRQRFDPILRTKREQYHLYMIEIELVNRIYKEAFRQSKYRFALIAHCLRDFRPDCRSVSGDIEAILPELSQFLLDLEKAEGYFYGPQYSVIA